jgi:hypothetical protein
MCRLAIVMFMSSSSSINISIGRRSDSSIVGTCYRTRSTGVFGMVSDAIDQGARHFHVRCLLLCLGGRISTRRGAIIRLDGHVGVCVCVCVCVNEIVRKRGKKESE